MTAVRVSAAALAVMALFGFNFQSLAATDTWTGADTLGSPTTDWVNADNWAYSSGAGPVASGDSLVFTSTNGQATNILTDSLTNSTFVIAGITFNAGSPAYTLTGNVFELAGGITNFGSSVENIANAVVLSGTETFTTTAGRGNIVMSGPISDGGTGQGVTTAGSGILRLSGSNSYSGATTVAGGTVLRLVANSTNTVGGVTSALSNSSYELQLNTGSTLQLLGNTNNTIFEPASAAATSVGLGVEEAGGGTYNFYVGNDGGTASPTTLILGNMGTLGETGNVAYAYNVGGANGYTLQLGSGAAGNGALYFENNQSFNVTNPGVTVSVPGGFDLNYVANNYYTVSFGGQGNYTVGSIVGLSGDTYNVNFDTTGTVALTSSNPGTGNVSVNAGTAQLNFNASGAPATNIINSTSTLGLSGGTLQVIGATAGGTSQTFVGVTAGIGQDVISAAPASGTNLPAVALGTFAQSVGGTMEFIGPATIGANNAAVAATATITTTTLTGTTGAEASNHGLLWNNSTRTGIATVGLYDWASTTAITGSASPYTIIGGSQVPNFYTSVAAGATVAATDANDDILGNAKAANGTWYGDTLRFNVAQAATFTTNATGAFYIGGILVTPNVGAFNTTLANGAVWLQSIASGGAVDVYQNNTSGELLLNVPLYGTMNYVQAGPGTVNLTGQTTTTNTYTNPTYLNGGYTVINANYDIGNSANEKTLNLNGGTVVSSTSISLDNGGSSSARPITLLGNGGGLAAITGDTLTVDGTISAATATTGNGPVVSSGPLIIGIPASSANGYINGLLPGTGAGTANTTPVYATGTVMLTGANTYSGGTELDSGTLNFSALSQIGGANYGGIILNGGTLRYASGNTADLSSGPVTILAPGGTLDVNGNAVTYLNGIGDGGAGSLTVASTTAGGSLTLDGIDTFTGGVTVNSGVGLTLNGVNMFTGATNVNGVLTLNAGASVGNSAITVASGASFNAKTGSGNLQIGTSGASLILNAGSSFSMADGSIGTLTLNSVGGGSGTVLTLGGTVASPANLAFDIGAAGADQLIVNNGTISFASGAQDDIVLSSLAGAAPASLANIPLLTVSNGTLVLGDFSLQTTVVSLGGASYISSLSLGGAGGDTELLLNLSPASLSYYWTGKNSGSWSVTGNFATDHTGATAQSTAPGAQSNVFLTADSATNLTQTLNQSFSINSLSFTSGTTSAGSNSITLSGGTGTNTLTLIGLNAFSDSTGLLLYAGGTGLVVQPGSAQHAISANIALGSSQAWEIDNAPSNGLIVTGTIGDGGSGYGLTKTGSGTLILAGVGTYTGATTVSSGTLQLGNGITPGGGSVSGLIVDNATLALDRPDNYSLGNIISGTGLLIQNGPDNVTLTATNSFTGSTVVSSGSLTLGNSMALAGSIFNDTNQGGTLSFGSLTAATLGGLIGTGNLTLSNTASSPVALTLVNNAPTASYSGSLSGPGSLTKNGTSILSLSGSSSYDGPTTVNAGVLQISAADNIGDGSANNTLTINGTTLESIANTYDLGVNRSVVLTGSDKIQVDSSSNLSISGTLSGAGTLNVTGLGNLTINGADTGTGPIDVVSGMLTIGPNGLINGSIPSLTVANGAALNVAGGNLTLPNVAGNPYLDFIAGGNNSEVYVSGGSFTYGNNAAADPNEALLGTFTQTGGTVTTVESDMAPFAGDTFSLYVGGTGQYISNAGLYTTFTVGTRGVASTYISGSGSLTVNGPLIVGAQFSGGGDTAGTRTFVQQGGSVLTNSLTLGAVQTNATSPGVYYLNGGTLTTDSIARGAVGGASGGTLEFGGGTLISGSGFTVAAGGITTLVNSGGGTINTSGGNITWSGVIGAGSTGNVTGYTGLSGGSGYTVAPTVTVSAPVSGTTATAVAEINASGQVIDIVITNPGSGYTTPPTFTFSAPVSGTTASVAGATIATSNGGLTKAGSGTLTLNAANTYSGTTNINGGVLSLSATTALGGGGPITFGGGTLQYSANNAADHSARIVNSTAPISLDLNGQNLIYGSPLSASNIGGLTVASSAGLGSLTLNGSNGYTGPTTISQGTLTLAPGASLSDTPITLAANATLAVKSTTTIGTTLGSLTMAGGSVFNMQDNTIDTVTLNSPGAGIGTVLNVGDSNAAADLYFDVNRLGSDELLVNDGVTSFGADGGLIYLDDIDNSTPLSSYTIISDPNGGLAQGTSLGADFQLGQSLFTAGGVTYALSLANSTHTALIVTLTAAPVSNAYWVGNGTTNNSSWSDITNFATDHTGATRITGLLTGITNIFLTADTASNFNQTLDGNYTVNSLNFTGAGTSAATNPITLSNGTGTALTIDNTEAYSDASGNHYTNTGIAVQAGAAANTINANIILGDSQYWEIDNAAANGLLVNGVIGDGGDNYGITKTGNGTLIFGNAETYTGGTTISAGTLAFGSAGLLPTTGTLTVGGTGTFDLAGTSQTVPSLSDGGVSTGTITDSTGAGTLTISNTTPTTYSGTITDANSVNSGASLALVLSGTSNVTLSGSNSFTGGTTLVSGDLTAVNNYALGSGTSQNPSAGLTFNNPGNVAAYFKSANPQVAALNMGASSMGTVYIILGNSTMSGSATTLYVGGGGGNSAFNGVISDLSAQAPGAIGNLTVDGGGYLALGGANTFTGTTVITGSGQNGPSEIYLQNPLALQDSTLNYNDPVGFIDFGSEASVTLAGLTGSENLQLANHTSLPVVLTIGNNIATSTYTGNLYGAGGVTKNGSDTIQFGSGAAGGATYAGSTTINQGTLVLGGTSNLTGPINMTGLNGVSDLTIQDNAVVNIASSFITENSGGYPAASTVIVQGNGSLTVAGFSFGNTTRVPGGNAVTISGSGSFIDNGSFNFYSSEGSTVGNSTVNLNGGTLAVQNFIRSGGGGGGSASTLNLNGGTLEALGNDPSGTSFLPALGALTANVDTGGAIINPNGYSITIAQTLVHGTGTPDGGLTLTGSGTLILTANNSYTGPTTVNTGTLVINGINALGGANYGGIVFNGGTLEYAAGFSGHGSGDITTGPGGTAEPVVFNSGIATINTNGNNVTFANPVGNNGAGGLTKTGLGNLTLGGPVAYNGATVVNQGTLTLSSGVAFTNAAPAVTVANGATLALNGNTIGTSGASLTLQGGSILNLQNNTINTVTINGGGGTALTVGDATGAGKLYFGINSTAADELVVNNGVTVFGADGGIIYLTDLDGLTPTASYTLVSDPNGGLLTGAGTGAYFQLGTPTMVLNGTGYSLSLATSTSTAEILTLTALSTVNDYWTGNTSTSWSVPANFATDHTGATAMTSGLNATSNVFLTADNPTAGHVATQTLDGNYTINSLSFTGTGTGATTSITLSNGTGSHLTLDPVAGFTDANGNNYAAGIGLVVQAGSAQHTIAATIALGESQTWEIDNAPSAGLIVTGAIGDGGSGYGLTKTGSGTLILAGASTYSGATTITSGTLQLGNATAGGSVAGNIVDNSALALDRSDNYMLGTAISGTGNLFQNGSDKVTLTATNTFSGTTTVNSGSLIVGNPLALQDSPYNTNGAGTLSFGSLTAVSLGGLIGNGNLALTNSNSLPVALSLGNNGAPTTFYGSMTGAGSLTKNGTSTLALAGANSYDGTTTINSGVLQISAANNLGDASVNNTITLNGGTLESTANTYDLGINRALSLTGTSTIQVDTGSALSVSGSITGVGTISKAGAGNLVINGADTATGAINVNTGMLTVGPNGSINGASVLTVANGAVLNIAGGSVTLPSVAGNPYLEYVAGGNNTQVYISGGSFNYGNNPGADPNEALLGTFTQTGGVVTTVESNMAPFAGDTFSLYVGGTGQYISNPGPYGTFTVGTRGLANAYVSGTGSVTVNGNLIVGVQYNSAGDTAGTRTFVQQGGTVTAATLTLGSIESTVAPVPGVYDLNGGTLTTGALNQGNIGGTSGGTLNFGGGTLISGSAFTVASGGIATNINSGGATINTSGGNIIWAGNIAAGTVGNVTGFTGLNGGGGYTTAPSVTIVGGNGSGASAVAEINASGQVFDVVITNPGSNYTSAPTFTFSAPTSGTTATVAAATFTTGAGGLTTTGTGTLTLSGTDTYAGPTVVTGGATLIVSGSLTATASVSVSGSATLQLAANNAIRNSAHLTLSNGTLQALASESESLSDLTLGTGGSVLSLGATGSILNFADSSADTWTGTLTIADWNGNRAGGGSDEVFIGTSADLSAAQLADITFLNGTTGGSSFSASSAMQLADGEIVAAIPEPGSWATVICGLAMLLVFQRRRRIS